MLTVKVPTDNVPATRAAPKTESEDPSRTMLLTDKLDPMCNNFRIDTAEPKRAKLRTDRAEPRWNSSAMESEPLRRAKPRIDNELPSVV